MFFNKIRLVGSTVIDLPHLGLANPADEFILKGADGLGPAEHDVFVANTTRGGGYYQGRRAQSREPVIFMGLNPNWATDVTAADLRDRVYGLLTSALGTDVLEEMQIQLIAVYTETEVVVAQTTGYLKRVEINPFTKDPQVQVTISCPDPYLAAPTVVELSENSAMDIEVDNIGSAPVGFIFSMVSGGEMTEFTLEDNIGIGTPGGHYIALSGLDLTYGDKLVIDTRPGNKGVYKVESGTTYQQNLLLKRSPDSSWISLRPGENHLYWTSQSLDDSLQVIFTPQYWGI